MLPYIEGNRRHAVDSRDLAYFLYRVEDVPDIAQFDRRPVLLGNDDARKVRDIRQPAQSSQRDVGRSSSEISARNFDVLALDCIPHLICRQAVCRQAVRVQQQLYLPAAITVKIDAADVVDGFKDLLDLLVNNLCEFFRVPVRRDRQRQDRR